VNISLCPISAIDEGEARSFILSQTRLFAVKSGGNIHVYINRCPHLGIQLQWQEHAFLTNEKDFIKCSNHGALFEIDTGLCISGPCRGEKLWAIESSIVAGILEIDDAELPLAQKLEN